MEAIRRPNRVLEGSRLMEAVLDMWVPFSVAEKLRFVIWDQSMYTRCQRNVFVCIAAISRLQRNINATIGISHSEKAAGTGGLF